jgi:nitroreductase
VRAVLDIPEELAVLCGLAIGYADDGFAANHLHTPRLTVDQTVVRLKE